MKTYVITGAAGFIGSTLCDRLLNEGNKVIGIDAFIPYYPREIKERNLHSANAHPNFTFHELDLRTDDVTSLLEGADVVINEAAMPGLVKSWSDFDLYSTCNQSALLRVLEAVRDVNSPHFIQISTSSVYGKTATGSEESPTQPFSPYGITKLAAENLCNSFQDNFGVPVTILRYFSVYGPRQRPDMAYHILIQKLLDGESFPMFGDGEQSRSNTYVDDCVTATLLAAKAPEKTLGETFNVGGGEIITLNETVTLLEELTGRKAQIDRKPPRPGDQRHTSANIEKIKSALGYEPAMGVREGLGREVDWIKESRGNRV